MLLYSLAVGALTAGLEGVDQDGRIRRGRGKAGGGQGGQEGGGDGELHLGGWKMAGVWVSKEAQV